MSPPPWSGGLRVVCAGSGYKLSKMVRLTKYPILYLCWFELQVIGCVWTQSHSSGQRTLSWTTQHWPVPVLTLPGMLSTRVLNVSEGTSEATRCLVHFYT